MSMTEDQFRAEVLGRLVELEGMVERLHAVHEKTLERVVENVNDFLDQERGKVVKKLQEMIGDEGSSDDWWKNGEEPPF